MENNCSRNDTQALKLIVLPSGYLKHDDNLPRITITVVLRWLSFASKQTRFRSKECDPSQILFWLYASKNIFARKGKMQTNVCHTQNRSCTIKWPIISAWLVSLNHLYACFVHFKVALVPLSNIRQQNSNRFAKGRLKKPASLSPLLFGFQR